MSDEPAPDLPSDHAIPRDDRVRRLLADMYVADATWESMGLGGLDRLMPKRAAMKRLRDAVSPDTPTRDDEG